MKKQDVQSKICRSTQCCGIFFITMTVCLALGLLSCSKEEHRPPPPEMKWTRHSKPTPLQPTKLTQAKVDKIKRCNSITELCAFDRFIQLQGVIVGDLSQIVRIKDFFFVFDRIQAKIYKFDLLGKFIQEVSRKGQGPGEFESILGIKLAFDQNIAIHDGIRGKISVFDLEGKFVTEYATQTTQGMILPGSNFLWPTSDRLILAAFMSDKEVGPWHVMLERTGREYGIVAGFGERFEPFMPLKLGVLHVGIFNLVGENIWVGSAYATTIDVYNNAGVFLHRIGNKVRPNGITKEHFDVIPKSYEKARAYRSELATLDSPRYICVADDLVLVTYRDTVCVFDHNGNIIQDFIPKLGRSRIYDSFGNEVYSPQVVIKEGKNVSQVEKDYLIHHLGIDLDNTTDLNPFIRVGILP